MRPPGAGPGARSGPAARPRNPQPVRNRRPDRGSPAVRLGPGRDRDPALLHVEQDSERVAKESVYTDLFRSVCPVTGQPDWASVSVQYVGAPIRRESLLAYLISFRTHPAFHETTIEQIYLDIMSKARPDQLTVYGRFLRRGGLDISPFRSNVDDVAPRMRLSRQ